jgi:hypothetical protein
VAHPPLCATLRSVAEAVRMRTFESMFLVLVIILAQTEL